MNEPYPLDHERLDVYRLAVELAAWVGELIDEGPLKSRKNSAVKHLDDSSRSIVNHIAEGNGKRSRPDRCRFFDISRGAARRAPRSEHEHEHEGLEHPTSAPRQLGDR